MTNRLTEEYERLMNRPPNKPPSSFLYHLRPGRVRGMVLLISKLWKLRAELRSLREENEKQAEEVERLVNGKIILFEKISAMNKTQSEEIAKLTAENEKLKAANEAKTIAGCEMLDAIRECDWNDEDRARWREVFTP